MVDRTGLHHLAVLEEIIEGINLCIVAAVSFTGKVRFYRLFEDENNPVVELTIENNNNVFNNTIFWNLCWTQGLAPNSFRLVLTSVDGKAYIYNLEYGNLLTDKINDTNISFKKYLTIPPKQVSFATCVAVSPSGRLLATGHHNGNVYVSDIDNGKSLYTFYGHSGTGDDNSKTVRCVRFEPSGKIIAISRDMGTKGTISLYDVKYGELIGLLSIPTHSAGKVTGIGGIAHTGWIFNLDFNSTGEFLVSGGYDGKARIWNTTSKEREATISISPNDLEDEDQEDDEDTKAILDVKFIPKGYRNKSVGDKNEGVVIVGLDKGIRWYREAGGL